MARRKSKEQPRRTAGEPGATGLRARPIAFESRRQIALVGDRYKLISRDAGKTWMLFDLARDRSESRDLAARQPEVVRSMTATVEAWRTSCKASLEGKDDR